MDDSQRFALENSPQIAKIIVIHQNFRRYCRKAILYPICPIEPKQLENQQVALLFQPQCTGLLLLIYQPLCTVWRWDHPQMSLVSWEAGGRCPLRCPTTRFNELSPQARWGSFLQPSQKLSPVLVHWKKMFDDDGNVVGSLVVF